MLNGLGFCLGVSLKHPHCQRLDLSGRGLDSCYFTTDRYWGAYWAATLFAGRDLDKVGPTLTAIEAGHVA